MGFEKLDKIAEIRFNLKTLGSLFIGGGDHGDSNVILLGGKPVIPGSSLKGALRSTLESLLSQKNIAVCVPSSSIPRSISKSDKKNDYLKNLGRIDSCSSQRLCPICEIFGTVGEGSAMSGMAVFTDALYQEEFNKSELVKRAHVAIERETRAQSEGALLTKPTVDAGKDFKGAIRIINYQNWQVGAILVSLEWLKKLGIGAKKSSGYGELEIKIDSVTEQQLVNGNWQGTELDRDAMLKAFEDELPKMEKFTK